MSPFLRVLAIMVSLLFTWFMLQMIRRERFLLKYAFLWLVMGVLGLLAALFPDWVYTLSGLLGFETPANFLFFACVVVLMAVSLILCAVVSRQTKRITYLVQILSIALSKQNGVDGKEFCGLNGEEE